MKDSGVVIDRKVSTIIVEKSPSPTIFLNAPSTIKKRKNK